MLRGKRFSFLIGRLYLFLIHFGFTLKFTRIPIKKDPFFTLSFLS